MRGPRAIYHLTRSDFLERIRRPVFLIIMGVTAYAGYMMVPPVDASYSAFLIGGHRGIYNAPWVGTVFGTVASTLLTLLGFYLVKNTVTRDVETRVGQVIATTPVSKLVYIVGKWLSNLLVLALILLVLTVMAFLMLLARGEGSGIDLWALVKPIWLMAFPAMAVTASLALFFESVPFLRGGPGNVIYFFIWGAGLMLSVGTVFTSLPDLVPHNDFAGLSRTVVDFRDQLLAAGLDIRGGTDLGVPTRGQEAARVAWNGLDWTLAIAAERSFWFCVGLAIALLAVIPFDRFDPARWGSLRNPRPTLSQEPGRLTRTVKHVYELLNPLAHPNGQISRFIKRLRQRVRKGDAPEDGWTRPLVLTELHLLVGERAWWWHAVAAGLVIAGLACPPALVRQYLLPAAWFWPVLCWSVLGNREIRYRTGKIVFSTPHIFRRQLLAGWCGGFLLALITGSGALTRLAASGEWDHVIAGIVGAAFIPALALALGVWGGSSRLFEIVYVIWWYVGSIDQVAALDFIGVSPEAVDLGMPLIYLAAAPLLLCAAFLGRWRRLRAGS